jgi:hypothetical protein
MVTTGGIAGGGGLALPAEGDAVATVATGGTGTAGFGAATRTPGSRSG